MNSTASSRAPDGSRRIVALEVASFPVAVERLRWPPLRGRPLIIASVASPRSPVVAVSPEAAADGVVPGQTIALARRACPLADVLPPDFATYRAVHDGVLQALGSFTPLLEPAGAGRFFLDVTASLHRARGFGPVIDMGLRVRRRVAESIGIDGVVGVAINKLVSGVAAEEAVDREPLFDVRPGGEASFLSPLPTARLPGVGERTEGRLLHELNVRRVGQLASIELPVLSRVFGATARTLHDRASGVDWTPVSPGACVPAIVETEILPADTNDLAVLRAVLARLTASLAWQLRRTERATHALELTLTHVDDVEGRARARLTGPCDDARTLLAHAHTMLETLAGRRVRVRAVTVRAPSPTRAPGQLDLFADAPHPRLARALDAIRTRYGAEAIHCGRGLGSVA